MKITDFDMYKDLIKAQSGMHLRQDQIYVLESRLTPIAKKWGYPNLDAMTLVLNGVPDPAMITDIVENIMTTDTHFFRDFVPFDILKRQLTGALKDSRATSKHLRIWCAGCASGQEAYSLAILIKELGDAFTDWTIEILASDISQNMIEHAQDGVYSQFEVQRGVPSPLMLKYFTQSGDRWTINDSLRKMVSFKTLNMMHPLNDLGEFDVVFCRNVLNSFTPEAAAQVLQELCATISMDGLLFMGEGEDAPIDALSPLPDCPSVFALKNSAHLA